MANPKSAYSVSTKKEKTDSRLIQHLLYEPVSDGGQWNMLVNIVNKYGIIPKSCMNETYSSSHSNELQSVLTYLTKLCPRKEDIKWIKYFGSGNSMLMVSLFVFFMKEINAKVIKIKIKFL